MVADGVEKCPACGSSMKPKGVIDEATGFTWSDLFSYSLYPILIGIGVLIIGVLCIWVIIALGR